MGGGHGNQCRRRALRNCKSGNAGLGGKLFRRDSCEGLRHIAGCLSQSYPRPVPGHVLRKRTDLTIEDYWTLIEGKTSALLAACTEIGAVLGGADEAAIAKYRLFGKYLGLAFQVQDDILGIWGNEALTGKSTASDLVQGKNSLPRSEEHTSELQSPTN